jgi:hypothetical protein
VQELFALWAKLGNATWPDEYHPVMCHLIDVAAAASNLWDLAFLSLFDGTHARHLGLEFRRLSGSDPRASGGRELC